MASLINGLNIPVITLDHPHESTHIPSILCDNRGGARTATEHLLKHGCRRIVCLGGDSRLYTIKERQKGYADAILSAGLAPMIEEEATLRLRKGSGGITQETDINTHAEVEAVLHALCFPKKRIDAIFALRNSITIFAFQSLQGMGLKIADDVALFGFDDFDLASTLRPAVTVVRQHIDRI